MFFFFFLNNEKRIGFKKLSAADLGLSNTSHQSHIGLYEGVLNFLKNTDVVKSAMLIYGGYCDILDCSFDRIENPDGSYRNPKIRTGNDPDNSIVSRIRKFAHESPTDEWYLAWSGLESEEVVFWLIKSGTDDYTIARRFFSKDNLVLNEDSPTYNDAKKFLLERINFTSQDIQRDIEVRSQIGDSKRIYKRKDIENAAKLFTQIGKEGEELIAQFLEKEKAAKRIKSFVWENQSIESGLPYDFIINDTLFVDVKSTKFDFDQYVFYSNQEIEFAASKDKNTYSVYRVYDMHTDERKLQVCNNCHDYMQAVLNPIKTLQEEIESTHSLLQTLKLGVMPKDCFRNISSPIIL